MTTRNRSSQLTRTVKKAIEEQKLDKLVEYWELYQDTCRVSFVEAFYMRTESHRSKSGGSYCNIAVIGDGLLVDIEADDADSSGNLAVYPLKSLSDLSILTGSILNFAPSQGASLVVLANRLGEEGVGLHWVAKTEEDEENLQRFAKSLIQAISKS